VAGLAWGLGLKKEKLRWRSKLGWSRGEGVVGMLATISWVCELSEFCRETTSSCAGLCLDLAPAVGV
jgi:hypothetical protein